jgi:trk system potassium uptake protein
MTPMFDQPKLYIVIVGCGGFGSYAANRLSRDGHGMVVIDLRSAAFQNLSSVFSGFTIEGDATEFAVLRRAKMEKSDVVVAATADDATNLMVSQIAKKIFGVPRVIARVSRQEQEQVYQDMGIDLLCPTSLFGDLVGDIITEQIPASDGGQEGKPQ